MVNPLLAYLVWPFLEAETVADPHDTETSDRGVMPPGMAAISDRDRWHAIHLLQQAQNRAERNDGSGASPLIGEALKILLSIGGN